jgi:hypothetical protein
MSDDEPKRPDVTDELPTLRELDKPVASDAVPTPHRPDGKVIPGGAAADDQRPAAKTEAGSTEDEPPPGPLVPLAGTPISRTLPSVDESDIAVTAPRTAKPTAVDPGAEPERATVVTRPQSPSQADGGPSTTMLVIVGLAIAVLGGGAFMFLRYRSEAAQRDDAVRTVLKTAATAEATSAPTATEAAAAPTGTPAATDAPVPTPTVTDAATATPRPTGGTATTKPSSSSTYPGVPPAIWPSGTPSWVPTAVPTVIPSTFPTGLPTTFPFPTSTPTTPPTGTPPPQPK